MNVELYTFTYGSNVWRFNSSRKDITHNSLFYRHVSGLSRGNIEDAGIDKADFDITFPQIKLLNDDLDDLAELFINRIFIDSVQLTITELNDAGSLVLFKGRIIQQSFNEDDETMVLTASTSETQQNRNILTRQFQRSCPNKIYDDFCGLSFEKWAAKAKVLAIYGLDVTVELLPTVTTTTTEDDNFKVVTTETVSTTLTTASGVDIVEKTSTKVIVTIDKATSQETTTTTSEVVFSRSDVNAYARGLIYKNGVYVYLANSKGLKLSMYRKFANLIVGDEVLIAMGCDQSFESCKSFGNNLRYMGFPFMPNSNPVYDQIIK